MKSKMVTLNPEVGNLVQFYVNVPVQNIGTEGQARIGLVTKVNRATFIVKDKSGMEHSIGREWSSRATYLPKIVQK